MKNSNLVFLVLSFAALLGAEEKPPLAEFLGRAIIKTKPDFVDVAFTVQSECQATPLEAQKATDDIVKNVHDYLISFKDEKDEHFKIIVSGGYTSDFSRWHQNRQLCLNTFQKSTSITLRLKAQENFAETFASMQEHSLKNFSEDYNSPVWDSPRAYVRISTPSPGITPENRWALEKKTLSLALVDGKEKFLAATAKCRSYPWKIMYMREDQVPVSSTPQRYYYSNAKMAMADSGEASYSPAPVLFDEISVEKSLQLGFQFDPTICF